MDHNPLILALDDNPALTSKKMLRIVETLGGKIWGSKINSLLFAHTPDNERMLLGLKRLGRVFADVKFLDIPETVAGSVKRLAQRSRPPEDRSPKESPIENLADFITVHASGGIEMMQKARGAKENSKIIAVTVLSSMTEKQCQEQYGGRSIAEATLYFASLAARAIMDGIVIPPKTLEIINRHAEFNRMIKIVPGIRTDWHSKPNSHETTITPAEAIRVSADCLDRLYMVVGRLVLGYANPLAFAKEAVERLQEEIDSAIRSL